MKTFVAIVVVACSVLTGIQLKNIQRDNEIHDAWDKVVVVADGTLVANPAYYAYHPEELAEAHNVRIISVRDAAFREASHATVETMQ